MHDRFICLNLTHCPHATASKVMLLLLDIVAPHGLLWVAFLALFPAACGLTMDTVAVCPCNHWLVTSTLPGLIPSITACVSLSLGLESARHHCCPWFISSSPPLSTLSSAHLCRRQILFMIMIILYQFHVLASYHHIAWPDPLSSLLPTTYFGHCPLCSPPLLMVYCSQCLCLHNHHSLHHCLWFTAGSFFPCIAMSTS